MDNHAIKYFNRLTALVYTLRYLCFFTPYMYAGFRELLSSGNLTTKSNAGIP